MILLLERDGDVRARRNTESLGDLEGDLDRRVDAAEELATDQHCFYTVIDDLLSGTPSVHRDIDERVHALARRGVEVAGHREAALVVLYT